MLDGCDAHLLLFQLPVASGHFCFHLVHVEPLPHAETFTARYRAWTELTPVSNGTFGCNWGEKEL